MTANIIPFVSPNSNEPIISSDYWGSESFLLYDILNALEINKDK